MNKKCIWNEEILCLDWVTKPRSRIQRLEEQYLLPRWIWGLASYLLPSTPPLKISQDIFHVTLFTPKQNKIKKVRSPLISGCSLNVTWCHGAISKDMYMLPKHYVTLGKYFSFSWTCLPSCEIGRLGVDYLPRSF